MTTEHDRIDLEAVLGIAPPELPAECLPLRVRIRGLDGDRHVDVPGASDDAPPKLIVSGYARDLAALLEGRLKLSSGVMTGRIRVSGATKAIHALSTWMTKDAANNPQFAATARP